MLNTQIVNMKNLFTVGVLLFCSVTFSFVTAEDKNNELGVNSTENGLPNHILLSPENLQLLVNISENIIASNGPTAPPSELETWVAPYRIRKNYPYYLSGHDLEGRPILIAEIGKWNLRAIVNEGGQVLKDFDKYVQQSAYRVLESIRKANTPDNAVTEAVFIADFDELNIVQMAHIPTVSYIIHLAQEYRELILQHMHQGFAVNTNFVAEQLINVIRPVFGEILSKIEILGTNPNKWKPLVLKSIGNRNAIPEWYGGTKSWKPLAIYG